VYELKVLRRMYVRFFSVIRVFNWRRMRWTGYVASMGRTMHMEFWWESQQLRDHKEEIN
jgi:hypothetical protein